MSGEFTDNEVSDILAELKHAKRDLQAHKAALMEAEKELKNCVFFLKDYLKSVTHPGVSRMVSDAQDTLATINERLQKGSK